MEGIARGGEAGAMRTHTLCIDLEIPDMAPTVRQLRVKGCFIGAKGSSFPVGENTLVRMATATLEITSSDEQNTSLQGVSRSHLILIRMVATALCTP